MPARKHKPSTILPLPPVPPPLRAAVALPPSLEPLLRVGKERLIFSSQSDDSTAFLPALIEPDS